MEEVNILSASFADLFYNLHPLIYGIQEENFYYWCFKITISITIIYLSRIEQNLLYL